MRIFLSIILLSLLALPASAAGLGWRELVSKHLTTPLDTPPSIKVKKTEDYWIVTAENTTDEELKYSGRGDNPKVFLEQFKDGKWVATSWDWCGTGAKEYSIPPKKSVEFKFRIQKDLAPYRYYTIFRSKDDKKSSMVLLFEDK